MGRWWVADRYGIARTADGERCIVAPYGWPSANALIGWERYHPLISHPHLFLVFARLAEKMDGYPQVEVRPVTEGNLLQPSFLPETDNNARIALGWARDYGVLGIGGERGDPDPRGGEKDAVRTFCVE